MASVGASLFDSYRYQCVKLSHGRINYAPFSLTSMAAQQVPSAPPCPVCEIPMGLVLIEPKVASLAELQIFRCFACGDVRSIEQKINPYNQSQRH
jgi:hypothetical protein